jgi:hypothetical protein
MDIAADRGEAGEMKHWTSLLLSTAILFCPTAAAACLYPPPDPQEAGETDAQYSARKKLMLDRYLLENARKAETSSFDEAKSVYLARVIRSEEIVVDGSPFARHALLKPLQSIKGFLPKRRISIKDRELTSCGLGGDGPATFANVGQVVIVFDGVRNEGMHYRSRLYATLAESAQDPRLLNAWNNWKTRINGSRD